VKWPERLHAGAGATARKDKARIVAGYVYSLSQKSRPSEGLSENGTRSDPCAFFMPGPNTPAGRG